MFAGRCVRPAFYQTNRGMTTDTRKELLKRIRHIETSVRSMKDLLLNITEPQELEILLEDVCTALQVSSKAAQTKSKLQHLVDARCIFAYEAKSLGYSYAAIGVIISRDHSSVVNYLKKYEDASKYDPIFQAKIEKYSRFKNGII